MHDCIKLYCVTLMIFGKLLCFYPPDPTEVYTWGNNTNFSLGHGNQESRHYPEIVDLFARTRVYVKQVISEQCIYIYF